MVTCNAIVSGRSCGCTTITARKNETFPDRFDRRNRPTEPELPSAALRLIEARITAIEEALRSLRNWIADQKDLAKQKREKEEAAQRQREAEEAAKAERLRQQESAGFSELDLEPIRRKG